MSTISIGNELKDSYKETYKWVTINIKWLQDLELFYRERAKLEKEYSNKLLNLTKEYFHKKSNNCVALSVGEYPTTTPGSLDSASQAAWNEILSQTELISKDHKIFGQEIESQISDRFSSLSKECEAILQSIDGFNSELITKRDQVFKILEKSKSKYDEACQSMENARLKQSKSNGDKAQKKVQQKDGEMNIAKNDYLIKISQANRIKDKHYFQDVPETLDLLQDLNESRIRYFNQILKVATSLERNLGKNINSRLDESNLAIEKNKPHLDTLMFIKHNSKAWEEPPDYQYIPSPVWHDDGNFAIKSNAELQDIKLRLSVAQQSYTKIDAVTQTEMANLKLLNDQKLKMKLDDSVDPHQFREILKKYLRLIPSFTFHEISKLEAEVEIESIRNNVSDYDLNIDDESTSSLEKKSGLFNKFRRTLIISGNNSQHTTNTHDLSSIHSSDLISSKKNSRFSFFKGKRDMTQNNGSSSLMTDNNEDDSNSMISVSISGHGTDNRVLYRYDKQDSDEVSVEPGHSISRIQADNGNGWTLIRNNTTGNQGLVPSTYIEINEKINQEGNAPKLPLPRREVNYNEQFLEVVYNYEAQGSDELTIHSGEKIKILKRDDGSGWTYGEFNGLKGLFPTNYCK